MAINNGFIILMFIVLASFVIGTDELYKNHNYVDIEDNKEYMTSSELKELEDRPNKPMIELTLKQKFNQLLKGLEQTNTDLTHELTFGELGINIRDKENSKNEDGFRRCVIVPYEAKLTDLMNLDGIDAGDIVSREECFNACDDDLRCKQAVHRLSKGSSVCYPMSSASNDTTMSSNSGEDEFVTLRCDQNNTSKQNVTGEMNNVYEKYKKKRNLQEEAINETILNTIKDLKREKKDGIMAVYKSDASQVKMQVDRLDSMVQNKMTKYNQQREEHTKLDRNIVREKNKMVSTQLHLIIWCIACVLGIGLTTWIMFRQFK